MPPKTTPAAATTAPWAPAAAVVTPAEVVTPPASAESVVTPAAVQANSIPAPVALELVAEPVAEVVATPATVTVTVPKAFKLRMTHHAEVEFRAGVCEMTREQAEHWYSKANGVVIYVKGE